MSKNGKHDQLAFGFDEPKEIVDKLIKKLPRDQDAREVIRGALDTNIMVLAGAGAGKTYELVERMVATLGAVGENAVRVNNLAAITFTRKAAGELRTRFYDRLLAEAASADDERGARLREAASRIDQCFIGTIHAFCSRLLRERPLEAGLPFDFRELDERDEPRARRASWTRFTNARLRAGDERLERLLEIGISAEQLYKFFSRRNEFPELELKPTDAPEPNLDDAVRATIELVQRSNEALLPDPPSRLNKWEQAVQKATRFLQKRILDTTADKAEFLLLFESTTLSKKGVTLSNYSDRDLAYDLRDNLVPKLKAEHIDPAIRSWKQHVYGLMGSFVDEAMKAYADDRRQAGAVTFSDLLTLSDELLRENPSVRSYFQARYRKILVDEFQDTDPVQAKILLYLTGTDIHEKDWRKLEPKPGTLFVVGDEKQSIYRFRRADVETFRFVRTRLAETGGEVVSLNTSFRSLGNLCDWLNGSFSQVFLAESRKYQAEYSPLLDFRPEGDDAVCVRQLVLRKSADKHVDLVEVEAGRIADYIAAASRGETALSGSGAGAIHPKDVSYGSFMILTWAKKYLDYYARALEARGIPYDLVGGGNLGDSDEVAAITQMLEAVADPTNAVPLIGYLRGMFVGLADDELLSAKKALGSFDYGRIDLDGLEADLANRLDQAYSRLRMARQLLETQPASSALEEIVHSSGLIPWTASSQDFMGSSRAGNLVRLLANVRRWQRDGLHWVEMVAEMRALIEDVEYDVQGMTLEAGKPDVVKLMNLHQAKGLQAEVVFLAAPTHKGYAGPPEFHVSRLGDEPYLSMAVQSKRERGHKTIAEPEGWKEDEAEERLFLAAEDTRLLYVAATRAENLLVVTRLEDATRGPWAPLHPALEKVPELEACEPADAPARVAEPTVYRERVEMRNLAFQEFDEPSWSVETPSAEGEDHMLFLSGERRGTEFGAAVHRMFDNLISDRIPDQAAYLESATDLDTGEREVVLEAAEEFRSSSIWAEMQTSTEVYTEAPFGRLAAPDASVIQRGRIDLVYKVDGGWKIVDFKTDSASNQSEVDHLVRHYGDQVAQYARHWSDITGEPVVAKGLWLTSLHRFVEID